MEPTELFPVVRMEPKRSYEIEISTPGCIAALEAEVKRLRAVKNGRIADLTAEAERLQSQVETRDSQNHEAMLKLVLCGTRLVELEAEVERLREALEPLHRTEWPHRLYGIVAKKDFGLAEQFARVMHDIHAALEP